MSHRHNNKTLKPNLSTSTSLPHYTYFLNNKTLKQRKGACMTKNSYTYFLNNKTLKRTVCRRS